MTENIVQRSPEWHAARLGSLGASAVHEVTARTKSGYSASRANRLAALVLERLTGQPQDVYQNAAMLHGIETEPEARAAYSFMCDAEVTEVGLIRHPVLAGTHASPDGLVGADGLVEIKCPQAAGHLALLMGQPIQDKHVIQMLWQMTCAEREWCDYVSYNPSFPPHLRLFVKRVLHDGRRLAELEKDVTAFLAEVDAALEKLGKVDARAAA